MARRLATHGGATGLIGFWRKRSLPTRTILVTTALVTALTSTLTWISIRRERQSLRTELEQRASAVLETLAISSRGLLFRLDAEGLAGIAEKLTSTTLVLEVRFYAERGRLVASSAGAVTSVELDPLGARLIAERTPLRVWHADRLTAGQTIEVADTVFGAVSVDISTRSMLLKVRKTRDQGIAVALVAAVLGIAVAMFFSRGITKPLTQLSLAARRIGAGDLEQRIPVFQGGDEIAVLSGTLEEMRRDLWMLYSVLESEVAERTRELEVANDALRSTNEELEAKAAQLEQFAYTISHDLKSPLITINSFLGYILEAAEKGDLERLREDLDRVSSAATHMRRLLDELLELSRIGRIVNPPEPLALLDLAQEAVDHVAGGLRDEEIEVRVSPDLPLAYGDRVRLLEVFENLVENAIKYRGSHNPRIEIFSRHQDGGGVATCVSDNGIGIEPAHQNKVFDLFRKLDPGSDGSGIGLAIAKRIIEVHDGRIWVESPGPGGGSCFCFTLPAPPAEAASGQD
jgi:signal transduction histidine kinase